MFIIIRDNKTLIKHNLSDSFIYKGIVFYRKENNYYITLKQGYYFLDESKTKPLGIQKYEVKNDGVYYVIEIYVYENDDGINDYRLYNNQNFVLAYDSRANIISADTYLCNYYLAINDGYINTNYDVIVNDSSYNNEKLNDGDCIDILGNRIYYYDNFLYINNFNILSKLEPYNKPGTIIKYPQVNSVTNFYLTNDIDDLKIEKIKKYTKINPIDTIGFIKSLLPSLIMSISMSIVAYFNIINNPNSTNIISYILMPCSICITGVLLPFVFYLVEKKNINRQTRLEKEKYIGYLNNYLDIINDDINKYLSSINDHYFDLSDFKNKIFYANRNSNDFLTLSVGKKEISKQIEFEYTEDIEINEHLNKIKKRLNHIDNYPLYIDIKENRIISFVSNKTMKDYIYNKVLLELSYKHHFEDISIALFSKNFKDFDNVYNLPHLFYHEKRLTYTSEYKLQELDQLKLDKPLILLIKQHVDFRFSNPNIYVIYFSCDDNDVYKDSDAIVHYLNTKGYIYKDNRQEFTYIECNINFNEYFSYLSRYTNLNKESYHLSFNDVISDDIESNYVNHDYLLKADFAYSNNDLLSFDLHESKQGPHGLIGGATGSGKSELIVSLLLSLCCRYPCDYLNIVLIDYKGSGISDSLSYKGVMIPHIIGNVSNLSNNEIYRLIIRLNRECIYRQQQFKKLSNRCGLSIMNIDDYLNNKPQDYGLEKMAHLLIVVDEFAQLKKESPEQIKELISISRIGRSLGMHLILATQKPSGIIDDQIWSNSRFKIALKVFEEKDSMDLIKNKDAAYLNKVGSFILQVDDHCIKGQSLYAKEDINGNDPYNVCILDDNLNVVNSYSDKTNRTISYNEYYCSKIIDVTNKLKLNTTVFDYTMPKQSRRNKIVDYIELGIVDDYINCDKYPLKYLLDKSLLIYSSRKNEINIILNSLNENKKHIIVIGSKTYKGKYISDSLLNDNYEDIDYLFKAMLSNKCRNLNLVIEDLNCLLSYNEAYLDSLYKIARRSTQLDISLFFITRNAQISYKLINCFENKVMIDVLDKNDLSYFYGQKSKYDGDSFFYNEQPICFVENKLEEYIEGEPIIDPVIKSIPEIINSEIIDDRYLLGYDINSKEKVYGNINTKIVSYDNKSLDVYKKSYPKVSVNEYTNSLKISSNNILWLGCQVFDQRLFVSGVKDDLKSNQGIYINNGRKVIIRSLINETNIGEI